MKAMLFVILVVIGLAAFDSGQTPPTKYEEPEAYAVYAAVIVDEWPVRVAKADKLVIQSETSDFPSYGNDGDVCLKPDRTDEATLGTLVKAYREANKSPVLLTQEFDLPLEYVLIPRQTVLDFFKEKNIEGWKDFYAKYPNSGGIINVSAVGFNADKTLALLYVGHSCGGLCGGGRYHLMSKVDSKWNELQWKGTTCTWAS